MFRRSAGLGRKHLIIQEEFMKIRQWALLGLLLILPVNFIGCMGGIGTAAVVTGVVYYEVSKYNDIAEVELKATPEAIYQKAMDIAKKTPDVSIIKQDDKKLTLEFSKGDRTATLKIKAKKDGFSLLTIESKKTKGDEEKTPNLVLGSVTKICDEMGIQYKVVTKKK
jgi:hypothetical protein